MGPLQVFLTLQSAVDLLLFEDGGGFLVFSTGALMIAANVILQDPSALCSS